MTLFGRRTETGSRPAAAAGRCAACRHFTDDPRALDAALPGLAVLSSAWASVRGDDGLCARHDRFASSRGGCAAFAAPVAAP